MFAQYYNRYPSVFLHGLFGWGDGDLLEKNYHYWGFGGQERDLLTFLRQCGFEVYCPSLGPVTGAWDRSCELWAYLKGGRVDYGKVHSEKYGHRRYGRRYPGVLRDWGDDGAHKKINILGHSFGGMNVTVFASIVSQGCQEEIDGTPADELSDFFKPNKKEKIHTATTLSGVVNGTTFADFFGEKGIKTIVGAIFGANALIGPTGLMKLFDFHTDQWDIMRDPASPIAQRFVNPMAAISGIRALNAHHLDNVGFEMQLATAAEVNRSLAVDPSAYYFARRACRTHDDGRGNQIPNRDMRKILKLWSTIIGRYTPEKLNAYGFNRAWLPSDGIVNVIGHSAPLQAPSVDGAEDMNFRPGIWYNMPVEDKHHMSWVGIGEQPDVFFEYYRKMLTGFRALPDGETAEKP